MKTLLITPGILSLSNQDEKRLCALICRTYEVLIAVISRSGCIEEKSGIQPSDQEEDLYEFVRKFMNSLSLRKFMIGR